MNENFTKSPLEPLKMLEEKEKEAEFLKEKIYELELHAAFERKECREYKSICDSLVSKNYDAISELTYLRDIIHENELEISWLKDRLLEFEFENEDLKKNLADCKYAWSLLRDRELGELICDVL